jgi:transposase InsO family protein
MFAEKKNHCIRMLSRALEVSASGYYAWIKRLPSDRDEANEVLLRKISAIHAKNDRRYGSPKMTKALKAEGIPCGKNRVARIMRENKIRSKVKRKFKVTTDSKHKLPVAENILARNFSPASENVAWVSDITYLWTNEGWLFLCVILDLFSRKVIGYAMDKRMKQELVHDALEMAVKNRNPPRGVIFHSDRGSQYAADRTREMLTTLGFIQSMSKKGDCYDNAVAESFFKSLKVEAIYGDRFATRDEMRQTVFEYMEVFYNRERIHSSLGYVTPERYEELASVS